MKRLSSLHKLIIGFTSFLLFFVGGAKPALAFCWNPFDPGCFITEAVKGLISWSVGFLLGIVNTLIGAIAWVVFFVATWLIDFALLINANLAKSEIIKTGFDTVLIIANLGIVVAIIVIAFMIMLRRESAGKLLTRFVIVAILVNFGYVIVQNLVLKPVDLVTNQINNAINFAPTTFSKTFVPKVDLGKLFGSDDNEPKIPQGIGGVTNKSDEIPGLTFTIIVSIASLFFSIAFLVAGTIVLFGFAGILMIRYVALGLLIILLPIAWVSWIFPNLKIGGGHPFTQWWSSFVRWVLFAPISMFFFWLAVRSVNNPDGGINVSQTQYASDAGGIIGDMVIVIGLLIGGMIVAQKMSIIGAGAVLGLAKKVGVYTRSYARQRGTQIATAPLRQDKFEKPEEHGRIARTLSTLNPVRKDRLAKLQATEKLPFVGKPIKAAGRGIMTTADKSEKTIVDRASKKYANMAPWRIAEVMANEQASDLERMAALKVAQEKGYAWETPAAQLLDRAHKKNLFDKYGMQKTQLDISAEGIPPAVINAIKNGESRETVDAIMRKTMSKVSSGELSSNLSGRLFTDFTGNDAEGKLGQHGLKEAEHKMIRDSLTQYLVEDRPNVINSIRNRLPGSAQAHVNTALEGHAKDGGTFEDHAFNKLGSTAADRKGARITDSKNPPNKINFVDATAADKQLYIQDHWTGVRDSLLKVETARINARTDLNATEKAEEISKAGDKLDSGGPQGVIAQYVQRERSRKGGFMFPFSP